MVFASSCLLRFLRPLPPTTATRAAAKLFPFHSRRLLYPLSPTTNSTLFLLLRFHVPTLFFARLHTVTNIHIIRLTEKVIKQSYKVQIQYKGPLLIAFGAACRKIVSMEVHSAQNSSEMYGSVEPGTHGSAQQEFLVQYIVVRKDLLRNLKWPMGSVITQACHAAVAAIWLYKDDQKTMQYCNPGNLQNMRKVTLEVDGEAQLLKLAQNLENASILYKLWIEQPENIPTCLATKPYCKAEVSVFFKNLKLLK